MLVKLLDGTTRDRMDTASALAMAPTCNGALNAPLQDVTSSAAIPAAPARQTYLRTAPNTNINLKGGG